MEQVKRSFEIVVEGQYSAIGDITGTPTIKHYLAKFVLPSQEAALSVICKHLLAPYLRKTHRDFIRYRTHKLVSITAIGRKPDTEVLQMSIEDMSVGQLSDFCILKGIMIDPYKHQDVVVTRERIAEAWRLQRQVRKEADNSKAGDQQKEVDALLNANDLPKETDTVQVNLREREVTAAAQVKINPGSLAATSLEAIESNELLPAIEKDASIGESLE